MPPIVAFCLGILAGCCLTLLTLAVLAARMAPLDMKDCPYADPDR